MHLGVRSQRLRKTEKSVNLRDILSLRLRFLKHLLILLYTIMLQAN